MIPYFIIGIFFGIVIDRANEYYKPFNPFKEHNRNVARYKNEQARKDRLFLNYLIKLK